MYVILYNPKADNNKGRDNALKLKEKSGEELRFEDITQVKDIRSYLKTIPSGEKIIIAGGDGTLCRFVNDMGGEEPGRDILYYPAGSGNDFMKDVGQTDAFGLVPLNKYIKNLPQVTVNGRTYRFINGIGYGIDGYCCEVGDALKLKSDKPVNYAGIAIKGLLFHFKPRNAVITVDGKKYNYKKVWLAPCMNGRFYGGGMMVAPAQNRLWRRIS